MVLNGLQVIGPVSIRRLLDTFDNDPVAILSAHPRELQQVENIGPKAARTIHAWRDHFDPVAETTALDRFNATFVDRESPDYPSLLREIYDPPTGLYKLGSLPLDQPCIAIVGSRSCSLYGQRTARKLAAALARRGYCIVSGLARGIDTAAHEGALEVGGKTIAVLGNGPDIIYPPENLDLFRRVESHGAILSEFRFGRRADRQTFPMRNRVVSGMSKITIVVETDVRGGSMITARFAAEQGRTLAAVPGRIDDPQSRGCLQLIQDGAILIRSVESFVDEISRPESLEFNFAAPPSSSLPKSPAAPTPQPELTETEATVLAVFEKENAVGLDKLAQILNQPTWEVSPILVLLELKRLIAKRSDGTFERR